MIEVFKTNINLPQEAVLLTGLLLQHHPHCKVNVDLEDCDRVLRVEGEFDADHIIHLVKLHNFNCEPLE